MKRPAVIACRGINPRTGRQVGERHRWPMGWGKGRCIWCHRSLDEARSDVFMTSGHLAGEQEPKP